MKVTNNAQLFGSLALGQRGLQHKQPFTSPTMNGMRWSPVAGRSWDVAVVPGRRLKRQDLPGTDKGRSFLWHDRTRECVGGPLTVGF